MFFIEWWTFYLLCCYYLFGQILKKHYHGFLCIFYQKNNFMFGKQLEKNVLWSIFKTFQNVLPKTFYTTYTYRNVLQTFKAYKKRLFDIHKVQRTFYRHSKRIRTSCWHSWTLKGRLIDTSERTKNVYRHYHERAEDVLKTLCFVHWWIMKKV